jgi:hypothetical protein
MISLEQCKDARGEREDTWMEDTIDFSIGLENSSVKWAENFRDTIDLQ